MNRAELWDQVDALHPWMVPARFGSMELVAGLGDAGGWTPAALRNHAEFRIGSLVHAVYRDRDLRHVRLLDVGCNCGYFAARHAETGRVASVLGVDGRARHIAQAQLYWSFNEYLPPDRYTFLTANFLQPETWQQIAGHAPFDVSLCCGILYHVEDYAWLLRQILEVTRSVVVIDTRTAPSDAPVVEPCDLHFNALPGHLRKRVPTLRALGAHLDGSGWQWSILSPEFGRMPGLDGPDDYTNGNRVTILAHRRPRP